MYKALYRKWRPDDFDSVCGQDHITDILKYQIANGKTSHAYLFCGSRGTGKTTCAKILAKAVNCENPQNGNPCNECPACRSIASGLATDVIEMDAASNNGVENVRDIKEEVMFSPAVLKYRVYIIDEVHMLSPSAFNALLKTLEEPPAHVIFILATTELQKLPSTIISRCQRYDFRRMTTKVLTDRLQTIAKAEGIALEEGGAILLARMAQGGMRDAISLFELCAGSGNVVSEATVSAMLGIGNKDGIVSMVTAISEKNFAEIYRQISQVVMESRDLSVFWQELIDYYRDMMVVKTCKDAMAYLDITENEYAALKHTASHFTMETLVYHSKLLEDAHYAMQRVGFTKRTTAELTLTRMCEPRLQAGNDALLARIAKLEEEVRALRLGVVVPQPAPAREEPVKAQEEPKAPPSAKPSVKPTAPVAQGDQDVFQALPYWAAVIDAMSERNPSIAGFLSKTKAYKSKSGGFVIRVINDFVATVLKREDILLSMKSMISEKENRNILQDPFEIVSEGKQGAYHLVDDLEDAIDASDMRDPYQS